MKSNSDARPATEKNGTAHSSEHSARSGTQEIRDRRSALKVFAAGISVLLLCSSLIFLRMNVYAAMVGDPTPTPSLTVTQSDTTTTTATASPTVTDTSTPDPTPTDTSTPTPSPTITDTPSPTPTRTPRHTPTPDPSPTVTDTPQTTPTTQPTGTATGPGGTTATPQGATPPPSTPSTQVTGTVASQNAGTGQTPVSNMTPTLNTGGNMPQSYTQSNGFGAFPVALLIAILASAGMIAAIIIAVLFIRQRLVTPTPFRPKTGLPPSGAQPWQRVRDNVSLNGNTNLYGEPIIHSGPALTMQQGFMPVQNAPSDGAFAQGMAGAAHADLHSASTVGSPFARVPNPNTNADLWLAPSATPFTFNTDNLLPASGALPTVQQNQPISGYLSSGMGANELLPESGVISAVQNYSPAPAVPAHRPHYKRGALRLRAMGNSGSNMSMGDGGP